MLEKLTDNGFLYLNQVTEQCIRGKYYSVYKSNNIIKEDIVINNNEVISENEILENNTNEAEELERLKQARRERKGSSLNV